MINNNNNYPAVRELTSITYLEVDKYLNKRSVKKDYYTELINSIFKYPKLKSQFIDNMLSNGITNSDFTHLYLKLLDITVEFLCNDRMIQLLMVVDDSIKFSYKKELLELSIKYENKEI